MWFNPQYKDVVIQGLAQKAKWMISQLQPFAEKVIIFLDEPILSALGTPAYMGIENQEVLTTLNQIIEVIHEKNALSGIHCCGNMDWGLLSQSDTDIIAFDAYYYGEKLTLYPEDFKNFLQRGGTLAYGIVPTSNIEHLRQADLQILKSKVEEIIKTFHSKGLSLDLLNNQKIYTPSCGMGSGSLTLEDSEILLKLLAGLSEH